MHLFNFPQDVKSDTLYLHCINWFHISSTLDVMKLLHLCVTVQQRVRPSDCLQCSILNLLCCNIVLGSIAVAFSCMARDSFERGEITCTLYSYYYIVLQPYTQNYLAGIYNISTAEPRFCIALYYFLQKLTLRSRVYQFLHMVARLSDVYNESLGSLKGAMTWS